MRGVENKMVPIEMNENAMKVLRTLSKYGAMSPSKVSAETWILPGETNSLLQSLAAAGFVLIRDDTNSPDGKLVAITTEARTLFNGSLKKVR
ncbi:MAG: hypothetical protein D6816_12310 [Bacteroidetes bacterium]|nr:MAG: hypothetical protein D6816_12310 [Bacteroidota bacterium]